MASNSKCVIDANVEFGLGIPSNSNLGVDANVEFGLRMPSTSKRGIDANKTNEVVVNSLEKKKIKPSVLSTTQVIELIETPKKVMMFDYKTYPAAAASTPAVYSFVGFQDNDGDDPSSSVSVRDGYTGDDGDMKPAARMMGE